LGSIQPRRMIMATESKKTEMEKPEPKTMTPEERGKAFEERVTINDGDLEILEWPKEKTTKTETKTKNGTLSSDSD
jgi:hypothetical protein